MKLFFVEAEAEDDECDGDMNVFGPGRSSGFGHVDGDTHMCGMVSHLDLAMSMET